MHGLKRCGVSYAVRGYNDSHIIFVTYLYPIYRYYFVINSGLGKKIFYEWLVSSKLQLKLIIVLDSNISVHFSKLKIEGIL